MREKIEAILDMLRPSLQMDGGDVSFVKFDDQTGVLQVRLEGHCAHCPMSNITLKQGIEVEIMNNIPEVKSVEAV